MFEFYLIFCTVIYYRKNLIRYLQMKKIFHSLLINCLFFLLILFLWLLILWLNFERLKFKFNRWNFYLKSWRFAFLFYEFDWLKLNFDFTSQWVFLFHQVLFSFIFNRLFWNLEFNCLFLQHILKSSRIFFTHVRYLPFTIIMTFIRTKIFTAFFMK